MKDQKKSRSGKLKIILWVLLTLTVAMLAAFGIYLSRYNSGNETALKLLKTPSSGVTVKEDSNMIAFVPNGEIHAGVVFYPGANIRGNAYTPLANSLAENGFLCVLVNMPLNIAALNSNAAINVMNNWPNVEHWYIAGHSIGGIAAEKCAYENPNTFDGLIMLASRIQYDFSDSDMPVLAVYATCDEICTAERVAEAKKKTAEPKIYTEITIEGGCHGNFGNYGHQFMDGTPTITREDQQKQTLNAILNFIKKNG